MGERTLSSGFSLVRYANPYLVPNREGKPKPKSKISDKSIRAAHDLSDSSKDAQEVLNIILPPVEWVEDGKVWRQEVSCQPATRLDVLKLSEALDMGLQERTARESGICAIRRELYTQAFDELIRQITINCAERGLLLLRIRDELKMTLASYQALYESSIAFGMRKALMGEQGKSDMEEEILRLKAENDELSLTMGEMKRRFELFEKRAQEIRESEEKKHKEELEFMKNVNEQLKNEKRQQYRIHFDRKKFYAKLRQEVVTGKRRKRA